MKSILEEASSIIEAIEKGWKKAGKPKQFSVKILEEPKKNFFGLTVRSAKIGIFFEEAIQQVQIEPQKIKALQPTKVKERREERKLEPKIEPKSLKIENEIKKVPWSEQMIENVREWLKRTLEIINVPNINFSVDPRHLFLKIQFDKAIFNEISREKQLFSSLATLMLQMLKNKYRRPLKGYKIILIGAQSKISE